MEKTNNSSVYEQEQPNSRSRWRIHHGRNVVKFRELSDLNQADLAKLLKVRQQTVSKWEKSETLDEKIIEKIAKALNIKPEFIRDYTRESIIQIFQAEHLSEGSIQNLDGNNTQNFNINPPVKEVSELLKSVQDKNKLMYEQQIKFLEDRVSFLEKELAKNS